MYKIIPYCFHFCYWGPYTEYYTGSTVYASAIKFLMQLTQYFDIYLLSNLALRIISDKTIMCIEARTFARVISLAATSRYLPGSARLLCTYSCMFLCRYTTSCYSGQIQCLLFRDIKHCIKCGFFFRIGISKSWFSS